MATWAEGPAEGMGRIVVAVKANFPDGSSHRGQAFAVANQTGGLVLITTNTVVRSDIPYNLTQGITATARAEELDKPETASLSLVEFHDSKMNLGLLYAPHTQNDHWPQFTCLLSDVPARAKVTILRRDGVTGDVGSMVGYIDAGFDAGHAVVRVPRPTGFPDDLQGAPVLWGDKFIGMVVEGKSSGDSLLLSVLSVNELAGFLAKYFIRSEFHPTLACMFKVSSQLNSKIERSPDLEELIRGLLAQKPSWSDLANRFAPSDADITAIFETEEADRVRTSMAERRSDLPAGEIPVPPSADAEMVAACLHTPDSQLKPGIRSCVILWDTADSGEEGVGIGGSFVFIHGHWVWMFK
jgi:hypothetical protein